jgi:hypothetical protein
MYVLVVQRARSKMGMVFENGLGDEPPNPYQILLPQKSGNERRILQRRQRFYYLEPLGALAPPL